MLFIELKHATRRFRVAIEHIEAYEPDGDKVSIKTTTGRLYESQEHIDKFEERLFSAYGFAAGVVANAT